MFVSIHQWCINHTIVETPCKYQHYSAIIGTNITSYFCYLHKLSSVNNQVWCFARLNDTQTIDIITGCSIMTCYFLPSKDPVWKINKWEKWYLQNYRISTKQGALCVMVYIVVPGTCHDVISLVVPCHHTLAWPPHIIWQQTSCHCK